MALSRTSADPRLHAAAASIVKSLGGEWKPSGAMCRCPAHDDHRPSLSVRVGERGILFKCFAGCSTLEVIRALRGDRRSIPSSEGGCTMPDGRKRQLSGRICSLWKEASPVNDTPADAYLASRRLAGSHPSLRYHDRVPYGRGETVRFRPALLAAVECDTGVVALERLFLDLCTGLPVTDLDPPKRLLGRPLGGAVRFGAATSVLGLAEGWETAWSAHFLLGIPVWAALGSDRLPFVTIPERVEHLILLPDDDPPGRRCARRARHAHARPGLMIETRFPGGGFNDWNDRHRAEGGEGGREGGGWGRQPDGQLRSAHSGTCGGMDADAALTSPPYSTRRRALTSPQPSYPAMLPLSKIVKGDNPRRYFDRKKHDEMVASIRLRGIIQPILLRPRGDVFAIVAGERRYRAGLEVYGPDGEVPVIIREMTDQEALEAAIAENDDRDDPSETEQADAAVRYLAACQGDRAEAIRRLGWS